MASVLNSAPGLATMAAQARGGGKEDLAVVGFYDAGVASKAGSNQMTCIAHVCGRHMVIALVTRTGIRELRGVAAHTRGIGLVMQLRF